MSRYFCLGRFIEIIKEIYQEITKLIICFDPRKSAEKNKVQSTSASSIWNRHYWEWKERALGCSKLLEICGCNVDDDSYEIVATISEGKNKTLNISKNFQLLDVSTDLKNFTTKDKKMIEDFLVKSLIMWIVPCLTIWSFRRKSV
jgi:hypothetical protein